MADEYLSDEYEAPAIGGDTDVALAEVDPSEGSPDADIDNDPEEVLSAEYLETPEEAAAEAAFDSPAWGIQQLGTSSTVRRSGGRSKKVKVSEKQARRAKLIIYGGTGLLVLAVLVLASIKLPLYMNRWGWIEQSYIWPWSLVFEDTVNVTEHVEQRTEYKAKDGRTLTQEQHQALMDKVTSSLNQIRRLFTQAEKHYQDFQNTEDDTERYEHLNMACDVGGQALDQVVALQEEVQQHRDISTRLNQRIDSTDKLLESVTMKVAQWRKQQR